jgi:polyisoprenoid-binding protein YceI
VPGDDPSPGLRRGDGPVVTGSKGDVRHIADGRSRRARAGIRAGNRRFGNVTRRGTMDTTQPLRLKSRRPLVLGLAMVAVAAILAGSYGLWYVFLRPSGPAAVGQSSIALPSTATASSSSLTGSIDGTWNVDTTIGSFSDFTDSFVGYRVQEQLASLGGNVAVGRTPDVSGSLTISGTSVTAATIEADLTGLKSDDDRRDGQLARQGIETATYPTATFTLTTPIDLGTVPTDGQAVEVTAHGTLTLHGQTREVDIPLTANLSGSTIVVGGSLQITFADYGIEKPASFAVLSIADQGTFELQLFFTKA